MTEDIRALLWNSMAESPFLMVKRNAGNDHAEPLIAQVDPNAHGAFWFYTSRDNRIAPGGPAMAQFVARDHSLFCCIAGTLVEESDPAVISRYWTPTLEAWYDKGRDDPNLLVMRFDLDDAEIWKPDNSIEGLFRMMTGKAEAPREMGFHKTISLKHAG
ncbi:MAG: general stress protein [Sphingomonadales bacterium]|nr:MAG: general stress protein [Sphingomonadales bacterium]TNF04648.1 MAG: general stress protein [Sphingomonadales bacterium]